MENQIENAMESPEKSFWQVSVTLPKDLSDLAQEFMIKSGALGFHEVLYEEGKTDNLNNDSTIHYYYFALNFPVRAFMPMALAMIKCEESPYDIQKVHYDDFLKTMEETFTPFKITDRLWIVPPWKIDEELPLPPDGKKLIINPAFAFGTGRHATTQLMLEVMNLADFNNKIVLEVGSGSGVLGIYALMLGARNVVGIEVEGLAVDSSRENLELNRKYHGFEGKADFIEDDFTWIERNADFAYDIFLSNILPDIFYQNEKNFMRCLVRAKTWMLSGIVVEKRDEFFAWLTPKIGDQKVSVREKDGWVVFYNF